MSKTAEGGINMGNEYEVVAYEKLRHFKVFLNRITYRNFHIHSAFELELILEGTGQLNLRDSHIGLTPGALVILNPNEPHEIDAPDGVLAVIFQVSQHFCQDYIPTFRHLMFHQSDVSACFSRDDALYQRCCELVCKASLCYLREEEGFDLGCISYITDLFRKLVGNVPHEVLTSQDRNKRKKRIQRITRLTDYLDENYLSPVRLQDLAELEGLTPTHVSHLFTDYYGISFQEYLNNLRFEKAMTCLRNTQLSQVEIAESSGFSDPKYLSRTIQKRLGCSLREYQEQMTDSGGAVPYGDQSPLEYWYPPEDSIDPIEAFLKELR